MMRYLFLFSTFLFFYQHSQAQMTIEDPNAEVREVNGFHSVQIAGAIDVYFTKGSSQALVVSAPEGRNQFIVSEVKGGVLHLSINGTPKKWYKNNFRVYISYTDLQSLNASGATSIKFAEPIELERLSIDLSGAAALTAHVNIDRLSVTLKGASDVKLSGAATELSLICSGASDFKSPKFTVKKTDIRASGASDIRLNIEESLTANASGASDIHYTGNPKTDIKTSGASSVSQQN